MNDKRIKWDFSRIKCTKVSNGTQDHFTFRMNKTKALNSNVMNGNVKLYGN